jgi:hypothetical protein
MFLIKYFLYILLMLISYGGFNKTVCLCNKFNDFHFLNRP